MSNRKHMLREEMISLIELVQQKLPDGMGATLLVFSTEEKKNIVQYISTAERPDMINTMEELLINWRQNNKGESNVISGN